MSKRRMTKSKIGYTNEAVPWVYGWNPGGFGCSGGCDGCWARSLAKRFSKCEKCRRFEVHLHEERLCEPANTKRPGLVLGNFTCDTFDRHRSPDDVGQILRAAGDAPWHQFVFLTQQPRKMRAIRARLVLEAYSDNWHMGLTIRDQAEADAKLPEFLSIPGNLWLSPEPLRGAMNLGLVELDWPDYKSDDNPGDPIAIPTKTGQTLAGVIVGHDNRRGAPGTDTLDHIRSVVQQCQAAGVPVYVKQLWHRQRCGHCLGTGTYMGGLACPHCKGKRVEAKPQFLRASHPNEYALYPDDLKLRDLPWSMPEAS